MKTIRYLTLTLLIFVTLAFVPNSFAQDAADEVISIPDTRVKGRICAALKVPNCRITKQDMERLTELSLFINNFDEYYNYNFKSIVGLEYAINLTKFQIHHTLISDITPLSGLTKLTWLHMASNEIVDIEPLAGLVNLELLELWQNKVSDITPLSGLTNLTDLSLGHNQITDISPLTELTNLTSLTLSGNQITDTELDHLTTLTNLTHLTLGSNQITDIRPLTELTNLTRLGLGRNQLTDIRPLTELTNLTFLTLYHNQITDTELNHLTKLTNLTRLYLDNNKLTDISPLADLTSLEWLYLDNNKLTDISPLADLTNLTRLELHGNQISDVSPLLALTNLERLYIYDNPIKNIKPLLTLLQQNPGIIIYLKSRREALPVTLSHFSAEHTDAGIILKWTTESEVDNAGFYIYRSKTKDGEFKVVNTELIQGAGTIGERNEYTWTDTTAKPNTVYYYRIEDVSHAGVREQLATVRLRGFVSASGKRTTSWADLKGQE